MIPGGLFPCLWRRLMTDKNTVMKLLVTAGPTCEDLDAVRFLTNRSSGRMGYAIAAAAAKRGHDVALISGPTTLPIPWGARRLDVRSAAEMLAACEAEFVDAQAAIFAAAVADFRPAEYSAEKIKKQAGELHLRLVRTEDIAACLGACKGRRVLVGFALETENARHNAERKLREKNLDAIVLNRPDSFGGDLIRAEIFVRDEPWRSYPSMRKAELAAVILDLVETRITAASGV